MKIAFTAEGATQTDLEVRQLYDSRVRGKDKCMCKTESWVSILTFYLTGYFFKFKKQNKEIMLTLIISAVVIFILVFWSYDWSFKNWDGELAGTLFFFIPFITFMILGIIWICHKDEDKWIYYEYADQEITSLINKDESTMYGSFFLGCGSVSGESTDYYVAYAKTAKGDLRVKVDAYKTYVQESDDIQPVIKNYYARRCRKAKESIWAFPHKAKVYEWKKNYRGEKTVIVPTNTIYKEFLIRD